MKAFLVISACLLFLRSAEAQFTNRGLDFLAPANFNYPVRQQLWHITGDDPFISKKNGFRIELSYNYSSAENYFDPDGNSQSIKMSYFQYNKGNDQGGYFRKHGAILSGEYHWRGVNKAVIRFPFTFTEMKSYSSTTDVKPQEEFIKPRGPFQDLELSYVRRIPVTEKLDVFAGAGVTLPTSRPKRYLDTPHGGYGDRWSNNLTLYLSYPVTDFRFTGGLKYALVYPATEELYTPRPYGIGFPFLYDTTQMTEEEVNSFIDQNKFSVTVNSSTILFCDFVTEYVTAFGLNAKLHFQYFNNSGDEFESPIPFELGKENGTIVPVGFISKLDGGNSGVLRIYLQQDLGGNIPNGYTFTLGYGLSLFGTNAQQEANLILGFKGSF